jgi:hypothetical protein
MQTPVMVGGGAPAAGATQYSAIASFIGWNNTEANVRTPIPIAGTISNFRVRGNAALTQGQWVFTLRSGAAGGAMSSSTVTATLTTSAQEATDGTNTLAVAAGDQLTLQAVPTGSPAGPTNISFSFIFTATVSGESFVIFGHQSSSATTAGYLAPGQALTYLGESLLTQGVMPTGGVFSNMYVYCSAAPTGGGNTRTLTLRKNGANEAGVQVALTDTATNGNDTSGSVSYAAGDLLNVESAITGTPTASLVFVGLRFVPTTPGESLLFSGWSGTVAQSNVFSGANARRTNATTTETTTQDVAPAAFTWRKLYVAYSAAPGAGDSRIITARKAAGNLTITKTVSETGSGDGITTGNDTSNSESIVAGDLIDWAYTFSGTPATAQPSIGSVAYIAPAAAGGTSKNLLLLGVG